MKNSAKLWEVWNLSKAYPGIRPSEFVGARDEFAAYCFDRAVYAFGSAVDDAAQEAAEGKKKAVAQAAAANAVALWTGAPMKFANPTATR